MRESVILVSTWADGIFAFGSSGVAPELAGESVRQMTLDPEGVPLAIVGGNALYRRAPNGAWARWAEVTAAPLSCCVATRTSLFLGTNDARMLCMDRSRRLEPLPGFQAVPGRERWYAGTAVIDGKVVGPPLGVRSLTVTCDGAALLANVHVGGIPRSLDGGHTWQPTIEIETDVHEVRAHPSDPTLVAAATAVGLAISRDAGRTWILETEGLHAPHCASVAFLGDDILVGAASDPFASEGAVYRRRIDREGLRPLEGGLPRWTHGIVDTHNIAVRGSTVAMADQGGHLYLSHDHGHTWSCRHEGLPGPSSVLICPGT